MYTQRISGMVLIIVLVFLQIFSILGLCALQSAWMEEKMAGMSWAALHTEILTENALEKAINELEQYSVLCQIESTALAELSAAPLSWWQSNGCAGQSDSFQYYYVVEHLGENVCAAIEKTEEISADYYRITVLGLQNKSRKILQATTVLSSGHKVMCEGSVQSVSLGRQSWREVIVN